MPLFKWSNYGFHISRQSRVAIWVLVGILIVLFGIQKALPHLIHPPETTADTAFETAWQKFQNQQNKAVPAFATDSDQTQNQQPDTLFDFNPNTVSKKNLIRFGLPMRTVYTWLHYRKAGGQFYQKEDLKKLYTLSDKDYNRLKPYIVIPKEKEPFKKYKGNATNQSEDFSKTALSATHATHRLQPASIPLNKATVTDLIKLPGIGSVLSNRMIHFRTSLGGFYDVAQLKEVYGLPDSTFQKIKAVFYIKQATIHKIHLNKTNYRELSKQPYLRPYANAILKLRKRLGSFTSVRQILRIRLINADNYRKIAPYLTL